MYNGSRDSAKLTKYEKYIRDIAMIFGADAEQAKRDAKDIVDFETQLAKVSHFTPPDPDIIICSFPFGA